MSGYNERFLKAFNEMTKGKGKTPVPTGNYVASASLPGLIFSAGQIAICQGEVLHPGKIGLDITLEQAYQAARLACLNCLSGIYEETGTLENIERIVKLNGYVCCDDDFNKLPEVMDGASDVLVEIFGEKGKHPRATIGVAKLTFNASVEVEIVCSTKN